MVARDGIEPPTPAFSGPRSTTELSGLSADFELQFPAWNSGDRRRKEGKSTNSALQQLATVYQLPFSRPNAAAGAQRLEPANTDCTGTQSWPDLHYGLRHASMAASLRSLLCLPYAGRRCMFTSARRICPAPAATPTETRARPCLRGRLSGPPALRAFLTSFPRAPICTCIFRRGLCRDLHPRCGRGRACVDPAALTRQAALHRQADSGQRLLRQHRHGRPSCSTTSWSIRFPCAALCPRRAGAGTTSFSPSLTASAGCKDHNGEWVDEVASRAAAQNQQYLELMETPPFGHACTGSPQIGWNPQLAQGDREAFAQFRQQLLDRGIARRGGRGSRRSARGRSAAQASGALRHAAGGARVPG